MKLFNRALPLLLCAGIFTFLTGSVLVADALGRDVSFQWSPNPEPLTGYKLYYKSGSDNQPPYNGTGIDQGASPIILSKITTVKLSGLSETETYHFALTAYSGDTESDYSEIVTVYPDPSPKLITIRVVE